MQAFQAWNEGSIPSARTTNFRYRAQPRTIKKIQCLAVARAEADKKNKFRARAGVGEPGQTVNLLSLTEVVRLHPLPPPIFVNKKSPNGDFLFKKIECLAVAIANIENILIAKNCFKQRN